MAITCITKDKAASADMGVSMNINSANKSDIVEFVINSGIFSDMITKFKNGLAQEAADAVASYLDDNGFDFVSDEAYNLALEHFTDFSNAKYSLSNDAYGWVAEMTMTEVADLSEFNEIAGVSITEIFNLNKMTVEDFLSLVEDWDEIVVDKLDDTEETEILHRVSMSRIANLMIG